MTINTWGEFEIAIDSTINSLVEAQYGIDNYAEGQKLSYSLFTKMLPAIDEYYRRMGANRLGEPNEENLNTMLNVFWDSLKRNNIGLNKETFVATVKAKLNDYQQTYRNHETTITDMACFRFAADGRKNDGTYWSLENLGNLSSKCDTLGVKEIGVGQGKRDYQEIRQAIITELGNHTNRQCALKLDDKFKVYLCGGFGKPHNRLDDPHNQSLAEHMWLEIHNTETNQTISIDTFPSRPPNTLIGAITCFDHMGPPSEPSRSGDDARTLKQEINGLTLGHIAAMVSGENSRVQGCPNHVANGRGTQIYIEPNGNVLVGNNAKQALQKLEDDLRNAQAQEEEPWVAQNNNEDEVNEQNEQNEEPPQRSMGQQVCDTIYQNRGRIAASVVSGLLLYGLYRSSGNSNSTTQTNEPPAPTSNPKP